MKTGRGAAGQGGSNSLHEAALFADAGLTRRADGALLLGGVSLEEVAREVGTPAYVYNAEVIRARVAELAEAFAPLEHRIYYAVKANSCLAVLQLLRELGTGCDIVSVGELRRALAAGFAPDRLVFSGVGKRTDELAQACAVGIGQINLESLEELEVLSAQARAGSGPRVRVAIRVNPDVTVETHPYTRTAMAAAKFGVPADQVLEAARRIAANDRLELRGLAMHVGSQVLNVEPFVSGARRLVELTGALREEGIGTLRSLDLGGGLGIRYLEETPLTPRRLADALVPLVAPLGLTIHLEPGRYLVGSAGVLLARVLYRKHAGGTDFVIVDTGMNDLERPSRYQAHHEIVVVRERGREARPVDVVGPICESGDFLALARPLPEVEPGDLLAVLGAGAYGFVMSSNYNDRPRPPEIMVERQAWRVARRRETLEDLIKLDLL
ncbi:MAG TPA: diaminopimelate decarboxylase [Gemmatimonadales bacterium]|nr:diaminopimelate decarboxylase [Gemmatimonadales bacterium]